MAITRKPKAKPAPNVDVDALISRGGSVTRLASTGGEQKQVYVQLRLPKELVTRIDASLSRRPVRTPRHMWLLEAIHEKLQREG